MKYRGAGALLYRKQNNIIELLVISKNNDITDIGGKREDKDKFIYETVAREVDEETNQMIKSSDILERAKNAKYIYTEDKGYATCLIESTDNEKQLKSIDFDFHEKNKTHNRIINWININDFKNEKIGKINKRINKNALYDELIKLKCQSIIKPDKKLKNYY